MEIMEQITRYVAEKNMTYGEFAKLAKVSPQYLSQLYTGTRKNPSRRMLEKFKIALEK